MKGKMKGERKKERRGGKKEREKKIKERKKKVPQQRSNPRPSTLRAANCLELPPEVELHA